MYCSDMPNVVSAINGTSHEIQIPSNEPQQQTSLSHNVLSSTPRHEWGSNSQLKW
jgi:hypothetical protein